RLPKYLGMDGREERMAPRLRGCENHARFAGYRSVLDQDGPRAVRPARAISIGQRGISRSSSSAQRARLLGGSAMNRLDRWEALARLRQPTLGQEVDDLSAPLAQEALGLRVTQRFLNRKEAAALTERSPKHFDKTLRPALNNYGTEDRPKYLREEIELCLRPNATPGLSASPSEAATTSSVSRTRASVMKNPQARRKLLGLSSTQDDATPKSSAEKEECP